MNIYKKLLEVKKKIPYLKKDKKGFNYSYVTPTQVFATINPILNEAGLLLITAVIGSRSQRIEIETSKGIKKEWLYDLDILFTWVDCETAEKLEIPFKASGCNGEEKGFGSALTYAERYFILKQFNIPTDDDDPDAFQNKYMSIDDKKNADDIKITEAIADMQGCLSLVGVQYEWTKHRTLQANPEFIAAKEHMKLKFSPAPAANAVITKAQTKELSDLIKTSTMSISNQGIAATAVVNAKTQNDLAKIKTRLLILQPSPAPAPQTKIK